MDYYSFRNLNRAGNSTVGLATRGDGGQVRVINSKRTMNKNSKKTNLFIIKRNKIQREKIYLN